MQDNDASIKLMRRLKEMCIRISKVVAEGVETLEHVNKLRELDCDYLQGYYFSKPIPAKDASALLQAQLNAPLIPRL